MELVVSASYSGMEASVVHSHVGGFTHLWHLEIPRFSRQGLTNKLRQGATHKNFINPITLLFPTISSQFPLSITVTIPIKNKSKERFLEFTLSGIPMLFCALKLCRTNADSKLCHIDIIPSK